MISIAARYSYERYLLRICMADAVGICPAFSLTLIFIVYTRVEKQDSTSPVRVSCHKQYRNRLSLSPSLLPPLGIHFHEQGNDHTCGRASRRSRRRYLKLAEPLNSGLETSQTTTLAQSSTLFPQKLLLRDFSVSRLSCSDREPSGMNEDFMKSGNPSKTCLDHRIIKLADSSIRNQFFISSVFPFFLHSISPSRSIYPEKPQNSKGEERSDALSETRKFPGRVRTTLSPYSRAFYIASPVGPKANMRKISLKTLMRPYEKLLTISQKWLRFMSKDPFLFSEFLRGAEEKKPGVEGSSSTLFSSPSGSSRVSRVSIRGLGGVPFCLYLSRPESGIPREHHVEDELVCDPGRQKVRREWRLQGGESSTAKSDQTRSEESAQIRLPYELE